MKLLSLVGLGLLALSSCSVNRKIEKAQQLAYKYPDSFALVCARLYPVKDSVGKPQIEYVPSDNKNYQAQIDSLSEALNSAKKESDLDTTAQGRYYRGQISKMASQVKRLKDAYKPCKPDTIRITVPVYQENTAMIAASELELAQYRKDNQKMKAELIQAKKQARNRLWALIGIGVLAVGGIAWKLKGFFIR